jgi:O-antigen ligase
MMAGHGVLGLCALLLLYFAPAWIFIRRLAQGAPQSARVAAAMGLCVCLGFFAFGLTELMFRGMGIMSFYALMIAWLMALSDTGYLTKTSSS